MPVTTVDVMDTDGCWSAPGVKLYAERLHGRFVLRAKCKTPERGQAALRAMRAIVVPGENSAGILLRPLQGSNPWPQCCAVRSFPDPESMLKAARHVLHQCSPPGVVDPRQLTLAG